MAWAPSVAWARWDLCGVWEVWARQARWAMCGRSATPAVDPSPEGPTAAGETPAPNRSTDSIAVQPQVVQDAAAMPESRADVEGSAVPPASCEAGPASHPEPARGTAVRGRLLHGHHSSGGDRRRLVPPQESGRQPTLVVASSCIPLRKCRLRMNRTAAQVDGSTIGIAASAQKFEQRRGVGHRGL